MIRALKCDLKKVLISAAFAASILVTFVLCLSTEVYKDRKEHVYSVVESLTSFDREFMGSQVDFCSANIFEKALYGYSAMFLPILSAFPFIYVFCKERSSGNIRLSICRTKRIAYYISKFITAILCGGICIMLGTALFGIFAFAAFPDESCYSMPLGTLFPDGVAVFVLKKLFSAFLYGCVSAIPAFVLCAFCKNIYIITCVPFLLKFIQDTLVNKILANSTDDDIFDKMRPFESDIASRLPYMSNDKTFTISVIVISLTAAAALTAFVIIMELRTDKGE